MTAFDGGDSIEAINGSPLRFQSLRSFEQDFYRPSESYPSPIGPKTSEAAPYQRPVHRALNMFSLVLAGEAIFGLPFHVSRYFRPTYVEVFEITQTQLGLLGSTYGFVAMFAYLLGGGLADRCSPRTTKGSVKAFGRTGNALFADVC